MLTSGLTFSSGNWIAVILQDNGLARVVGEPTSNRPSAYGEDLPFQMARTGLRFTVSSKKWTRPAPERDPANTLTPDILIPTTIHDVRLGRDPQLESIRSGS